MTSPTSQADIIQLGMGDTIPIGQIMMNMILMGIVTDVNNPNMFAATLQAYQRQAVMTIPVLQGGKGDPGEPSFALRWQNDDKQDPSQLPTDLGNTVADLGKFWVFGVEDELGNVVATTMYVWWGTAIGWRQLPVGAPGPPGPYPLITPHIILEEPGSGNGPGGVDTWIHTYGSIANPQFDFHIAAPQGVPGPSAALGSCPDVDMGSGPNVGDVLMATNRLTPGAPTALLVSVATTGGHLGPGAFFYKVTATLPNGETLGSNEVTSGVLSGTVNKVTLNWTAPSGGGATGYRVYRGTTIGGENKLIAVIPSGATTTFVDDGTEAGTPASLPSTGVVAGRRIWTPQAPKVKYPMVYTIPESAFTSIQGIGSSTQTICVFDVPPQDFPWKPIVFGQVQIFGLNISFTPLLVGCEVLLGNATSGTRVARGFGNSLGYTTFLPHPSSQDQPALAMTPTNGVGLVQANHSGDQGKLYVKLVNQGMAGTYDFEAVNSGMFVAAWPVPQ